MIVDVHVHLGSEIRSELKTSSYPSARPADLITVMDACHIDRAVVFPIHWQNEAQRDPTYALANREVRDAVAAHSDRLIGFARVNPNYGRAAIDELDRCLDGYGMRGIKLHPDWDSFFVGGPLIEPVLAAAADRALPVLIHAGYPMRSQPMQFLRHAERFSSVPIILAHMAHRMASDAIALAERAPNILLETSCQWSMFVMKAVERLGPERVLFGSDFPYEIPAVEMAKITEFPGLDKSATALVLGGNAERLLGLR
jgi:predicted TIM-barrel fold metal-dependent hydrolase